MRLAERKHFECLNRVEKLYKSTSAFTKYVTISKSKYKSAYRGFAYFLSFIFKCCLTHRHIRMVKIFTW